MVKGKQKRTFTGSPFKLIIIVAAKKYKTQNQSFVKFNEMLKKKNEDVNSNFLEFLSNKFQNWNEG